MSDLCHTRSGNGVLGNVSRPCARMVGDAEVVVAPPVIAGSRQGWRRAFWQSLTPFGLRAAKIPLHPRSWIE
jgi:hypothetical protein